ncbi:hypothetical protein LXA43DRAFT_1100309 [Ganoderma leucocontextum]|nr:hypothetical protein LXA43DRAFT_1100309 [Ganoderma leucocontextum]
MPNYSETEKTRIRELTKRYLPKNLAQKEARRDCPNASLHHHQASYGQKNFANIGVIFEFCRAEDRCNFDGTPLPLQMSVERRVDLLSELEALEPPPYHDPAHAVLCRSIRDRIILSGDVTTATVFENPATPTRECLSRLGLQSLARSGPQSSLGSTSSMPSTSTRLLSSHTRATPRTTPQTSGGTSSDSKGPERPKRNEFEVTVYGYLRNGHPLTTAKAVGHLTRRKQVEFKFWQDAVAQAFGFTLQSTSRPKFELYLPLGDQWTDRLLPMVLLRGQPVLVRGEGVRDMPTLDHLKPLLNPPFNPNGVCPLSTLLDYSLGFPSGSGVSASDCGPSRPRADSDPSRILANIFGGPPDASSEADQPSPGPSCKRPREARAVPPSRKALKSSPSDATRVRDPTPDDVIILSDSEDTRPAQRPKGKARVTHSDSEETGDFKQGKGKGRATISEDDIIDLT